MSKRTTVVVIGASHAGLAVSHKLLRQASSACIILISPSDKYYFNLSTPRFLVKPMSLQPNQYLYDILPTFDEYPSGAFNFVKGLVTGIDFASKSVQVSSAKSSVESSTVAFDYLVIASGSTTPAAVGQGSLKLPFKTTPFEDTKEAIADAQARLEAATSVVIGGGGPLGVELAGELAETAGVKTITLVSKTSMLLHDATETVQRKAEALLRKKNVEVLKNAAVEAAEQKADGTGWTVTLSTGRTIAADEYISTTGSIPNNQFVPKQCLDHHGWVKVDEYLRIVDGGKSRSDTYAVGDITFYPDRLLSRVSAQASTVASNITASIASGLSPNTRLTKYSPAAQRRMMVVPVGQSTGTGHFGGWTLCGFLVWFFKGRDFLTYEAPKFLRGKQ